LAGRDPVTGRILGWCETPSCRPCFPP
jgi:hypothetical protein